MMAVTGVTSPKRSRRGWLPFQRVRRSLRKISGRPHRDCDDDKPQVSHISHIDHPVIARGPDPEVASKPEAACLSREQLEESADPQPASPFFSRLPPEIRRMVYAEVWRTHTEGRMRLHFHCSHHEGRVRHTPCIISPDDMACEDAWDTEPFPVNAQPLGGPPTDWFQWTAWSLRTRWGNHWRCQKNLMSKWAEASPLDRPGWSPFLPLFLTCKQM